MLEQQPHLESSAAPANRPHLLLVLALIGLAVLLGLGLLIAAFFMGKATQDAALSSHLHAPNSDPALAAKALPQPSVANGFSSLFGVPAKTAQAHTGATEISRLWFEHPITLGAQRYWVQFFVSQALGDDGQILDAHATSASVSAISYMATPEGWTVIGKQRDFTQTGSYGQVPDAQPQLLALSQHKTALLTDASDFGQGLYFSGKSVLLFDGKSWSDAGYIGTEENNSGTCADEANTEHSSAEDESSLRLPPCYAWEGEISIVSPPQGRDLSTPDLQVRRSSTLNAAQEALRGEPDDASRMTVLYHFENGEYRSQEAP